MGPPQGNKKAAPDGKAGAGAGAKGKQRKRRKSEDGNGGSSETSPAISFEISQTEGNTFRGMGMYKRAINSYTKALSAKPTHKAVLLARSQCYQQIGDNVMALTDANRIVEEDKTSVKGLLQKADVYYQMGQFEYALVLYHRGHKFRPEIQGFRLGIQKSQEAIENSIGEDVEIRLEKKGDLSFFIEEQKPPSKRKDALQRQQQQQQQQPNNRHQATHNAKAQQTKRKTRPAKDRDTKTVKQLLGELYEDVNYLEALLHESEKTSQTKTTEQVSDLATECLDYLDSRTEFWQQQQPTYSREQERNNRITGIRQETMKKKQKKKKKKNDPTKWVIAKADETEEALNNKDYAECIDVSDRVLKELERYSEAEIPRKREFQGNLHSFMGVACAETGSYEEAARHHRIDYNIAKELESEQQVVRALDNLGGTYAKMGRHREAIKTFTERLHLTSSAIEEAWLYHDLGRCHLEMGNNFDALECGEKSRNAAGKANDEIWKLNATILIAETELNLKNKEKALRNFEEALELSRELRSTSAEQAIMKVIETIRDKDERPDKEDDKQSIEHRVADDDKEGHNEDKKPTPTYRKEDNDKEDKKLTIYKISVTISDVQNAATDGDLELEIFGQKGSSGRLKLGTSETNSRKHERGQTDHFTISADGVGEISKVVVRQVCELPGLGCHLDHVTVQAGGAKTALKFRCNRWLDTAMDDGLIERELLPDE